jgi:DNA-binding CsgD family transcriptional regulator
MERGSGRGRWWRPVGRGRESDVLEQMATGRNNATIAKTLFMSERAVERHIGAVFQKLGLVDEGEVNRRVMAVLAFLEATPPPPRPRGPGHPPGAVGAGGGAGPPRRVQLLP